MSARNGYLLLISLLIVLVFLVPTFMNKHHVQHGNSELKERKLSISEKWLPGSGELSFWMKKSTEELIEVYGEPLRKDLSMYGYVWWIYPLENDHYIQFGIHKEKVETIFAIGSDFQVNQIKIGDSYQHINEKVAFESELTYQPGVSFYNFLLGEDDIQEIPLSRLRDDIYIQFYFDNITEELASIRLLTGSTLLLHGAYEVEYRGELPEPPALTKKEMEHVERGMERQVFDLTNIFRNQINKSSLIWDDHVQSVALSHSKDMADNNYFSHYGLNGTGLKERLAISNIFYLSAGENIAAQYTDGPAAVLGWMNSEKHRQALLRDDFTHLGVGVYRMYYTQNFLAKPY